MLPSWLDIYELVNKECQGSAKWKYRSQEIRKIFPLLVLKGSFTSHISHARKEQYNGENQSGTICLP